MERYAKAIIAFIVLVFFVVLGKLGVDFHNVGGVDLGVLLEGSVAVLLVYLTPNRPS